MRKDNQRLHGRRNSQRYHAQICEVSKSLLSVSKVVTTGNEILLDKDGSYIEDIIIGDNVWIKNVDGMYMLKLWVTLDF